VSVATSEQLTQTESPNFLFGGPALALGLYTLWAAGPGIAEDHIRLSIYLGITWYLVLLGSELTAKPASAGKLLVPLLVAFVLTSLVGLLLYRLTEAFENGPGFLDYALWSVTGIAAVVATTSSANRDLSLIGLSFLVLGYFVYNYLELVDRAGAWTQSDFAAALIAIVITLEVARRGLGAAMPLIALAAFAYAYFGSYFPDVIAHRGASLERIVNYTFYSQEGIFGIMTSVMANYVFVFILLGAFMNRSGMGRFFIEFPLAIAGRTAGGPAKVAVFASGVFGSISGSSLANIVSTGTFTIPLMKRVGFRPEVAGAVENSASLGGQLLPPVMGAGVFVMAEITGVPYVTIIGIAAVPALLYFLSVGLIVHFEAKKQGIEGLPEAELRRPIDVFWEGWFHIIPFAILLGLLISGYSPDRSAVVAIASIVAINWIRIALAKIRSQPLPDERFTLASLYETLVEGGRNSLVVGSIAACVGILVGMIALTGFGLKLSLLLVAVAGGSLLLTLVLIALASLVLGMALPITAAYLVLIVLAGPALENLGVPLIAAHLIVFWLSQDSNITPPVCLGAFVAASIAKAEPWPTAWLSFRFAKMLYVMPLLFAYTPILFTDTVATTLWTMAMATVGTIAFSAWTMGYFQRAATMSHSLLLAIAALCCFLPFDYLVAGLLPGYLVNLSGACLLTTLWLWQKKYDPLRNPLPSTQSE